MLKPIASEFGIADATVGQLATMQALVAAIVAVLAAPLLDRYQRGIVLQVEFAILTLGTIVSALAPNVGWLLAGRALAGLGGAFIFAGCLAAAGDLFPDTLRRNRAIGIIWTAATLASFLGVPILAQVTAHIGWRWAFAALLVPVALGTLGTLWLPARTILPGSGTIADWLAGYRNLLAQRQVPWLVAIVVIVHLIWGGAFIYFGAYVATRFSADANVLSILFLVGGGAEIAMSIVTPSLLRRFQTGHVFVALGVIGVLNFFTVELLYRSVWSLVVFVVIVSIVVTGHATVVYLFRLRGGAGDPAEFRWPLSLPAVSRPGLRFDP